jgi:aquaporin Z
MLLAVKHHWPEYLMEAAELAVFMFVACGAAVLIFDPRSPVAQSLLNPIVRRFLMGLAMGGTAIAIIYSPWGKRSGAHFNPAVTLTYYRLGKINARDAFFYVVFQFTGGIGGVGAAAAVFGNSLASPDVDYIVTVPEPGSNGIVVAFVGEFVISFLLFTTVLYTTNHSRLADYTGWFVGTLVATYVLVEAPFSGMSMNPARTLGSACFSDVWTGWWIYFTAPPIAMLAAAELYVRIHGIHRVRCCKLHHASEKRCIFACGYQTDRPDLSA